MPSLLTAVGMELEGHLPMTALRLSTAGHDSRYLGRCSQESYPQPVIHFRKKIVMSADR